MGNYEIITQTSFTMKEMAALIDHSMLVPFASKADLDTFLRQVVDYDFKVCCLNNSNTEYAANKLAGTDHIIATVVAFPFGALSPDSKAAEIEQAIKKGAGAIDIVSNIGAIKSAEWDLVYRDFVACAEMANKYGIKVKAINETCYLTAEEIIKSCAVAKKAGLEFVKTSTGFGIFGYYSMANLHDIKLMKKVVGTDMGVKASGPIGDYETAVAFLNAGASRLGSRRGIDILKGCSDYCGD